MFGHRGGIGRLRFEDGTELLCELAVAVTDDMRRTMLPLLLEEHAQIARLLSHPCPVRVGRHAGNVDLPCADVDKEEHVLLDQSTQRPHFRGKEVASPKGLHMPLDKLVPSAIAAFRFRFKSVFLEDAGDSGSGNRANPQRS